MRPKLNLAIVLICVIMLPLLTGASPEMQKAISEYQRVLDANRSIRVFRIDEGAPKDLRFAFEDKHGYPWFRGRSDGPGVYRFDGEGFKDLFAGFSRVHRDSLLGVEQSPDKQTIIAYGKHHIYEWLGHDWQIHSFTKGDVVDYVQVYRYTVLCIGQKSYCILSNNGWKSKKLPGSFQRPLSQRAFFWTNDQETRFITHYSLQGDFSLSALTIKRFNGSIDNYPLSAHDSLGLYIKKSKTANVDSTLILSGQQRVDLIKSGISIKPKFFNSRDGDNWLYLNLTNILYHYDLTDMQWRPVALPDSAKIIGQISNEETTPGIDRTKPNTGVRDWLIYLIDDKVIAEPLGSWTQANSAKVEGTIPRALQDNYYHLSVTIEGQTVVYWRGSLSENNHLPVCFLYDSKVGQLILKNIYVSGVYQFTPQKQNPDVFFKNNYVINGYSLNDSETQNLHKFSCYNMQEDFTQTIELIDRSRDVYVMHFDDKAKLLFLSAVGMYYIVPLQEAVSVMHRFPGMHMITRENSSFGGYCHFVKDVNGGTHVFKRDFNLEEVQKNAVIISGYTISYFLRKESMFIPAGSEVIKRIFSAGSDPLRFAPSFGTFADLLALKSVPGDNELELVNVNLRKGEADVINRVDPTNHTVIKADKLSKFLKYHDETLDLEIYEKASEGEPYRKVVSGSLSSLSKTFDPILSPYSSDTNHLLEAIGGSFILLWDNRILYLPAHDKLVIDKTTGKITYTNSGGLIDSSSKSDSPRWKKVEIVNGNQPEIRIPAFLYNPNSGEIAFKPDWVGFHYQDNQAYVRHINKDAQGKTFYRSSALHGWDPDTSTIDPNLSFSLDIYNESNPVVKVFLGDHSVSYQTEDGNLHITSAGRESDSINIAGLTTRFGHLQQVVDWDDEFWLRFLTGIVRFNPQDQLQSYVSGSYGLLINERSQMAADYTSKQLLVSTDVGIYGIKKPVTMAKLHIPWLESGDRLIAIASALRIKYKQHDLAIPINILHCADPRQFQIRYQLVGYDKETKLRSWTPKLEYNRLPAGRYTLKLIAYSPEGSATKDISLDIRVLPPLWDTWWARLLYAITIFFLLRLILRWRLKRLKRRNQLLEEAINERTIELHEKQQRVTESIQYASLIQRSILPQDSELREVFSQHFVIWKPRDIVGGDFYWLHHKPETQRWLFAVIDCTGHGVPGALITMTANSILNHLVTDQGIEAPVTLLKELHSQLGAALHQEEDRTQQDGLEISMIAVDKSKSELEFAGAGLHLIHWHPELEGPELIRGYKHGLGGLKRYKQLDLSSSVVSYRQDSIFYMYTDGIIDQPRTNDERRIRFGHPQWLEFINRVAVYDLMRQQERFEGKLESLLEIHEQRDDITVVGMRI